MNILIVAQNASSRFGGEAFLPLKYYQILRARGYSVKLIVHKRNREDLYEHFKSDLESIYFTEDTVIHRVIWRLSAVFPKAISGAVFGTALGLVDAIFQTRLIRKIIRGDTVDVIHQPIPVSPKAVSSIYGFNIPVVIGPMNGGMNYPAGYSDYQSLAEQYFVRVARQFAWILNRIIPGKHRAAILLVANARTKAALPVANHPNVIEIVENGVDLKIWHPPQKRIATDEFRLVFVGRLVDWKAVEITLEAIENARARGAKVTLDILGDGEERSSLEKLVESSDLEEVVTFHGFVSQAACAEILGRSDAMILNSIYECGGAVVLEAMSLGLPVIAADWGGPADYLDPSCGILVSPVPRESYPRRLADAVVELARDPDRRERMGKAGLAKIHEKYDWDKKVDRMLEIYAEAIAIQRAHSIR